MNDRVKRRQAQKRRKELIIRGVFAGGVVAVMIVLLIALSSRGGDSDATGPTLSEAGRRGKDLAVQRSCVGCHGRSGEGGANGAGPAWVGLFGSTVELDDGSTVVADRGYLIESIRDPRAKQVAGYAKMPVDSISEADIMDIVAYIEDLAGPPPTGRTTPASTSP